MCSWRLSGMPTSKFILYCWMKSFFIFKEVKTMEEMIEHSLNVCEFNDFGIISCKFCENKFYRKDGLKHECFEKFKQEYFRLLSSKLNDVDESSNIIRYCQRTVIFKYFCWSRPAWWPINYEPLILVEKICIFSVSLTTAVMITREKYFFSFIITKQNLNSCSAVFGKRDRLFKTLSQISSFEKMILVIF